MATLGNQKVIKVSSYNELYNNHYLKGKLGVCEQRMAEDISKKRKSKNVNDYQLIVELLNEDSDNLYHVIAVDGFFYITIVSLSISKTFDELGFEYQVSYGEDGILQWIYEGDDDCDDASLLGELLISNNE